MEKFNRSLFIFGLYNFILPLLITFLNNIFWYYTTPNYVNAAQINSSILLLFFHFTVSFFIHKSLKISLREYYTYITGIIILSTFILFSIIILFHLDYSRLIFLNIFIINFFGYFYIKHLDKNKIYAYKVGISTTIPDLNYTNDIQKANVYIMGNCENIKQELVEKIYLHATEHKKIITTYDKVFEKLYGFIDKDRMPYNIEIDTKKYYINIKNILERLLIIITAPLTLTIIFITCIIVFLQDFKNPIFTQYRIGRFGKPFKIYKIRSMSYNKSDIPEFVQEVDMRITPFGKLIRKIRIDEIPQLYNVLIGDMSIIGPRPEQQKLVEKFKFQENIKYFNLRHLVRPGITGWSQVKMGYASNLESSSQKILYDLYYIKNQDFVIDILILYKTVTTIFRMFGSR